MKIKGKFTEAVIVIDNAEETAIEQVRALTNHPACTEPIVIMPDVHAGCASPIGFTMPVGEKIVPNIVSVDIGCGMTSFKYDISAERFFQSEEDMKMFDKRVRQAIPMGFGINENPDVVWQRAEFYDDLNGRLRKFYVEYVKRYGVENANHLKGIAKLSDFETYIQKFKGKAERIINGLGSLGGGNHFGECSEGLDGKLWITIHCGSRNFGKQVCDYHQDKAWQIVQNHKVQGKKDYIAELKDMIDHGAFNRADLSEAIAEYDRTYQVCGITKQTAYLQGIDMYEYLYDMVVAQTYSDWNRTVIQRRIRNIVGVDITEQINTTHNYISFEDFIIRKGAIASYKDQKMIIPFNPVDGILICEGKSNPDWNYSAPHGAGRVMSRSQANREISVEQAKEAMSTVYASETPVDESPLCYKDASMIENAIGPTATILDRLKPIVNFKAN